MNTCEKFATVFQKYESEGCRFVSGQTIPVKKKTGIVAWLKSLVKITS